MDFADMTAVRALLRHERSVWNAAAGGGWSDGVLAAALEEHAIAPLLHSRIHLAVDWPNSLRDALRDAAMREAALETFRLADVRKLLDALAARGIEVLIVKGTALAYSLYPSPELRSRGDTDLLIDAAQLDAVRAAMRELGYQERIESGDELAFRQALFTRDDEAGIVHRYDVHWAIANTALFADVLRYDELRAHSVAVPRIGEHARTLSDVDALLYACVHRVAHHHDSDRLIWLADIHFLRERIDEDAFWRLAAERGVVGVCLRSVERAQEWFGGAPHRAAEILDAATLARDEPTRTYLDRPRRAALFLADLGALPGWRARARRVRQLAFPPAAFMRAQFAPRSSLTLPWLYAYRAARGVARLFRRMS